jgi:hypothetical protein
MRAGALLDLMTRLSRFGLGYSPFGLLAAQRTPVLGSSSMAKESLRWLAMPSSGCCLVGLLLVLGMLLAAALRTRTDEGGESDRAN